MSFDQKLDVDLKLTFLEASSGSGGGGGGEGGGGGTVHEIQSAQVKSFSLHLTSWGFDGEATFDITQSRADDKLFTDFSTKKLIKVELKLVQQLPDDEKDAANDIKVTGYVTAKSVVETIDRAVTDLTILARRYTIRFADAAQVFWRQHRPVDLFIDQNFQNVVDAHKGSHITITMSDWSPTQTTHPIHFLFLGHEDYRASFYDFMIWFVDTQGGVWTYDHATDAYKLTATKDASGTIKALKWQEVGSVKTVFPETPRFEVNVLNSNTASASTNNITNDQGTAGVRRDYLMRSSIAADVNDRVTLETARLIRREPEVEVVFRDYPTVPVIPGKLLDFSHNLFGTNLYQASKTFRVRELEIHSATPEDSIKAEDAEESVVFRTEMKTLLELEAETFIALPPYEIPRWPAFIEGLVVSEQGDDGNADQGKPPEETYQFYTDSNTSLDNYKVAIPLFKSQSSGGGEGGGGGGGGGSDPGKILVVPYLPNYFPGHFYFPAYKKERVLLAIAFRSCEMVQYLEWRAGARLPMDGQGNHLLLGKKDKDQTSLSNVYTNNLPVVTLQRTKAKDFQSIVIEEGKLTITVKENQDDSGGGGSGGGA